MGKNEKAADLAMLARIKAAIKQMPTLPPVGSITGDAVQKNALAVRDASDAFRRKLGSDFERLAILRARLLPDALLPGACGYGRGANELNDPVVHYMCCYDLCGLCREEALREVDELARAVKRGRRGPAFLPQHVAQGRVEAANERVRAQNMRWTDLEHRMRKPATPVPAARDVAPTATVIAAKPPPKEKASSSITLTGPWARFDGRSSTKERFLNIANVFPRDIKNAMAKRGRRVWARYVGDKIEPTHRPRRKGQPAYYLIKHLKHHFERLAWKIATPPKVDDVERWTVPADEPIGGYDLNHGN